MDVGNGHPILIFKFIYGLASTKRLQAFCERLSRILQATELEDESFTKSSWEVVDSVKKSDALLHVFD